MKRLFVGMTIATLLLGGLAGCGDDWITPEPSGQEEPGGGGDPGPTDPGPTDPGPTDPGPTDPGPTDPGPTDGGCGCPIDDKDPPKGKVAVCHKGCNGKKTLFLPEPAVKAHLRHGDLLGPCK